MVYRESFKVQSNDRVSTFHNVTAKAKEIVEMRSMRRSAGPSATRPSRWHSFATSKSTSRRS